MGLFDRGKSSDSPRHYVELDIDTMAQPSVSTEHRRVHVATIGEYRDIVEIQDAVHDDDIVIADLKTLTTSGPKVEHIIDELRQTAKDLGGDVVKKGDDQIIITPPGVPISREKLGRG